MLARYDTRDTRCYFNVRSKADMSRLNLPHGTSYGPVSVCICLSQVGVTSKCLDGSSYIGHGGFHLTYPSLFCKEIQVSTKITVFSSGTLS